MSVIQLCGAYSFDVQGSGCPAGLEQKLELPSARIKTVFFRELAHKVSCSRPGQACKGTRLTEDAARVRWQPRSFSLACPSPGEVANQPQLR